MSNKFLPHWQYVFSNMLWYVYNTIHQYIYSCTFFCSYYVRVQLYYVSHRCNPNYFGKIIFLVFKVTYLCAILFQIIIYCGLVLGKAVTPLVCLYNNRRLIRLYMFIQRFNISLTYFWIVISMGLDHVILLMLSQI